MKKFKKMMALALAMVMTLSMSISVFAATGKSTSTTKGSITMDTSADQSVPAAGKTFKAYKLLDVTYDGDKYAYTVPSTPAALLSTLATAFEVPTKTATESDIAYNQKVVKAIETAAKADVEAAAKKLLKAAKDAGVSATTINGATAATGLDLGYYVIEDVTTTGDNAKPVSAVALTTTDPDVTIKVKATKPGIEKKIDEGSAEAVADDPDTAEDESKEAVAAGNGAIDAEDPEYDVHKIGDTVPYVLETTIPEMTGYTKYFFNVNDTLSKGLTFNNDVVIKAIKAGAAEDDPETDVDETEEVVRTLARGTDYTYTATANDDGTALAIVFTDFLNKEKAHAGEKIVITYSATVNADAVIGVAGNPNTVKLVYSNNPNITPDSDTDIPGPKDQDIVSETPEEQTFTYVTGIKLLKKDASTKNPLAGAEFTLSGNLNKVEVVKAEKYVADNETGTFYKLTDGTYTTTDPTTLDENATGYSELIAKYEDPTGATKYKKTTVTEKTASGDPKAVAETTDANGVIIFDGMGDGTFTLSETGVPEGYNALTDPIQFKVNWTAPTGTSTNCTWEVADVTPSNYQIAFNAQSGGFEVTILNEKGAILPSTGGMGTTILYILGTILVLGAGILLVTRRRMSAQ